MKRLSSVLIIRLAAIVLMLAALVAACFRSFQSTLPFVRPLEFIGEYSLDGGASWQTLPKNPDIPARYGEIIIKGRFEYPFDEGTNLNFFLDHITMELSLNGEEILVDGSKEIGLTESTCGRKWIDWTTPEISENDIIEIRLSNPHRFGNKSAYNEFFGNIYSISKIVFDRIMLKTGNTSRIIGLFVIGASIALLSVAAFFGLLRIDGGAAVGNFGALTLFFGGYITLDTIDVSLWSWSFAFNTYAVQICIMLAGTCAAACIAENIRSQAGKIARAAVFASGAVNALLALLTIFNATVIYDTMLFWLIAHIAVYLTLLGCRIYECICKKVTDRLAVISDFLLISAAFADMVFYFALSNSSGIFSKCVFLILCLVRFVITIRTIPMNYKAAREAERLKTELSEHRIAAMISQIQPHFIYNTLGSICHLCLRQPEKAAELTRDFSQYLRGNFGELENSKPILLSKELEHVKHYVNIEKVRFPDITVEFDIRSGDFFLPALTIQPLVENAIKHGLMGLESGGTVIVSVYETDIEYCVNVSDNGIGFDVSAKTDGSQHIGIRNIRERLKAICGGRLVIDSTPGNGTTAVIYIPKEAP